MCCSLWIALTRSCCSARSRCAHVLRPVPISALQVVDRTDKELLLKWQRDRNGQVTAGYTWLGIAPSQPPPPAKGTALAEVRVHTPHDVPALVEHIMLAEPQRRTSAPGVPLGHKETACLSRM